MNIGIPRKNVEIYAVCIAMALKSIHSIMSKWDRRKYVIDTRLLELWLTSGKRSEPTHQISALYMDRGSVRPIFVFRSLNKLGPLASESINYEAKTIINLENKPAHQISAL